VTTGGIIEGTVDTIGSLVRTSVLLTGGLKGTLIVLEVGREFEVNDVTVLILLVIVVVPLILFKVMFVVELILNVRSGTFLLGISLEVSSELLFLEALLLFFSITSSSESSSDGPDNPLVLSVLVSS